MVQRDNPEHSLNGLSEVDWECLQTPYGTAEGVPRWVTGLTSPDDGVFSQSLRRLEDNIYHQGTVNQVTAHVVPFLIELTADESTRRKPDLLQLLATLAATIKNEELRRKDAQLSSRELEGERAELGCTPAALEVYERRTYEAVREGVSVYLSLLSSGDPLVRADSAHLLSHFAERASEVIPGLVAGLSAEANVAAKTAMVRCLGIMLAENPSPPSERASQIGLLEQCLDSHRDDSVGLFAAISLLNVLGGSVMDEPIPLILEYISRPSPGSIWIACDALCKLDLERGVQAFEIALQAVEDSNRAQFIANAALGYAIAGKRSADWDYWTEGDRRQHIESVGDQISDEFQRRAIASVLHCDTFWENPDDVLMYYGLPTTREGLRQLLAA